MKRVEQPMIRMRSLISQSPAMAVAITALVFSLVGGAAAATVQSDTAIRWHQLKLVDSWSSSQGAYNTGAPSYAVSNGVVYLSGSMHHLPAGNEEFAVLPAGARPTHVLYINVYTYLEAVGTVLIKPNGQMLAYSADGSSAQSFTSLAGVCFALGS